tara:strand:- start:570 stop:1124 length:555 start_codon:yes stop_codon:yes gene_type:complete
MSKIKEYENSTKDKNPYSACNVNTSINFKIDFLDNDDINRIIWKSIDKMIEEINSNYDFKIHTKNSMLTSSWYNIYGKNEFQEQHDHMTDIFIINGTKYYPMFSGIYILHDNNVNSSVIFKQNEDLPPFRPFFDTSYTTFDTSNIKDIKEGSVILFNSHLEHLVKPCQVPGRVTIAFNVHSSFD